MNLEEIKKRAGELTHESSMLAEKWHALREEMQEHFDDCTEKWQESQMGDDWQALMDEIEEQADALDSVAGYEVAL